MWKLRNDQTVSSFAKMRDELSFFARAETGTIVRFAQPAPQFGYEFRRTTCKCADLRARLTMADGTRPIGDMNRDEICGILALRAVSRLTIHCRATTIEDHLETKIGIGDAALRAREARKDALALAAQVLDRFEQIAAPDQVRRI